MAALNRQPYPASISCTSDTPPPLSDDFYPVAFHNPFATHPPKPLHHRPASHVAAQLFFLLWRILFTVLPPHTKRTFNQLQLYFTIVDTLAIPAPENRDFEKSEIRIPVSGIYLTLT